MVIEFPKMIYKSGTKMKLDGKVYDTLIVKNEDEQESAVKNGWKLSLSIASLAEDVKPVKPKTQGKKAEAKLKEEAEAKLKEEAEAKLKEEADLL